MPKKADTLRSTHRARLITTRAYMNKVGVDALIVTSTDRYLNEYVPKEQSFRQWLTGFTGSTGDALITQLEAYIAVDGRYWLQVEQEVDGEAWDILRASTRLPVDQVLAETLKRITQQGPTRVGFAAESMTPKRLSRYRSKVPEVSWVALDPAPADILRSEEVFPVKDIKISVLDETHLGATSRDKLHQIEHMLASLSADALVVQRLDQLMWLANLRGNELPFQATFAGIGLVTKDYLYIGVQDLPHSEVLAQERPNIRFVNEESLWSLVGDNTDIQTIGYDPAQSTVRIQHLLQQAGVTLVETQAPLARLQSRKSAGELRLMNEAFHRADLVMEESIQWVHRQLADDLPVTEAQLADEIYQRFLQKGATGLSFSTICAAGQNGAFIHYGPPSPHRVIRSNDLVLIDTGAYFEGGYATDLTRTFIAGKEAVPNDTQRTNYTLVLKAAIAGMTAVLPEGANGTQLDAIVRAPLWAEGLDYNHGTGHGVGINVHEYPPRIGSSNSSVLEVGHVFSIEPGYYDKDFGGVRIENLCTLEAGPKGFMRVAPMTFSPLDAKLINLRMLTAKEKAFLRYFKEVYHQRKSTMTGTAPA